MSWLICLASPSVPGFALDSKPVDGRDATLVLNGSEDPQALARTLDVLKRSGRNVVVTVGVSSGAEAAGVRPAAEVEPMRTMAEGGIFGSAWAMFAMGFEDGNRAVPSLRQLPELWAAQWAQRRNGPWSGALVAIALALALGLALAVRRLLAPWAQRHGQPASNRISRRFLAALVILVWDAAGVAAFAMGGHYLGSLLLPEPDLPRVLAQALGSGLAITGCYFVIGRFLLAPDNAARRLLPMPRAVQQFWWLLAYGLFGPFTLVAIALTAPVAGNTPVLAGIVTVLTTAITLYKLAWFWTTRRDISALIQTPLPHAPIASTGRRFLGVATPWLLMASAVIIWAIGRGITVMDNSGHWSAAAGLTQILVILVPLAATGAYAVVGCLWLGRAGAAQETPLVHALGHAGRIGVTGLIWLVGIDTLGHLWGPLMGDMPSAEQASKVSQWMSVGFLGFAGWISWVFLKAWFKALVPGAAAPGPVDEDAVEADHIPTRLATVLPVMRGVVLGSVVGCTVLICLSRLGVDISPLLAGFGILGLAISFGSQTLVRDIVSGLFFMVEDAFRVGEYVDTGRLKGTVEKISLRSMQLRHQSGLVHTVPFGQVTQITNASRDWATVKFNLRLDHGTDMEVARKTVKKIGLALMDDIELGPQFIAPLKMQGVADIADGAIIVRVKFTAKPALSSQLQREALKRLYVALPANGIRFASNQVTVRGGEDRAGAAAMQAIVPVVRSGAA